MKNINRQCLLLGVVTLSSFGLAGCGESQTDGVPVEELVNSTQQNLDHSLRGVHEAAAFVANSQAIASSLSAFSGEECAAESVPCAAGSTVCPDVVETCSESSVTVSDLAEAYHELGEGIDDLLEELRTEVLIDANRESSDEHSVTYRLDTNIGCTSVSLGSSDAAPSPGAPQDPSFGPFEPVEEPCDENATRLQPRLRLTSTAPDSVTLQYLVGSARHNPLTFELSPTRLAAHLDLGVWVTAMRDVEQRELPNMSGKVEFELVENGARDFSVRVNVLERVSVSQDNEEGQPITISIAPSKPTLELRVNGNTNELRGAVDFGTLGQSGPLAAFRSNFEDTEYDSFGQPIPGKPYSGNLDLAIAGLEGAITFDGNADRLALTGLGLGDTTSTLAFNGTTIAALDVNPNNGRHFDVTVQEVDGRANLTFSPTLDLSLFLNFIPLAAQITDLPDYTLGDTLRFWLEGANPGLRFENEQLRVLSGTLNASSSRTPAANLAVPAGSCLGSSSAEAPGAHELLGEFAVLACE